MIKPEDFYSEKDYPREGIKNRMWKDIKGTLPSEKRMPVVNFDSRSFAFGFGAAFAFIFICVGAFTIFSKIVAKDEPAYVKVNNAYSKAIDEVEKSIPGLSTASANSYSLDERLNAGRTKLKSIDAGILEIKQDAGPADFSPVKQSRLRELYKMKLEILTRMIDMEENGL